VAYLFRLLWRISHAPQIFEFGCAFRNAPQKNLELLWRTRKECVTGNFCGAPSGGAPQIFFNLKMAARSRSRAGAGGGSGGGRQRRRRWWSSEEDGEEVVVVAEGGGEGGGGSC
jgi:hypothetical protein